jgi:hypothetical protein
MTSLNSGSCQSDTNPRPHRFRIIFRPRYLQLHENPSSPQRGRLQRSALRRSFVHRTHQPILHHSGLQEATNQLQHTLVADSLRHPRHQSVVVDSIKEFLQVEINHPAIALAYIWAFSSSFPARPIRCSTFRLWSASIAWGPTFGRGKAGRNLSWPSHFCILRRSDRQRK